MHSLLVQCTVWQFKDRNEFPLPFIRLIPPESGLKFPQNTRAEYLLVVLCSGMLKTGPATQVNGAGQFVFVTHFSDFAHRRIVSWNTKLIQSQNLLTRG
jgi:hypothetical protein